MAIEWRATQAEVGRDKDDPRVRLEVKPQGSKWHAKASDGTIVGMFDSAEEAKQACEEAQRGPQTVASPPEAAKAPEPPKPASEPPTRSGAHHAPSKGSRR